MLKTAAMVAVILVATLAQADAAKRTQQRHQSVPGLTSSPVYMSTGSVGYSAATGWRIGPGPLWAGPNECWTDEGYGRYAPCGGRSTR
jgi:hypothetical protein